MSVFPLHHFEVLFELCFEVDKCDRPSYPSLPRLKVNNLNWLVVSTHLKNISQIGNLPPSRGENKKYLKPPPSKEPGFFIAKSWAPSIDPDLAWAPGRKLGRTLSLSSYSSNVRALP